MLSLPLFFLSCKREGLGGEATVVVYPQFNSSPEINHISYPDTVYIKFHTTDFPGSNPGAYDTYFAGSPRQDIITCSKLKWGDYFFYVAAYDSTIHGRVTGGVHVKIRERDRKKTQNVTVALSE